MTKIGEMEGEDKISTKVMCAFENSVLPAIFKHSCSMLIPSLDRIGAASNMKGNRGAKIHRPISKGGVGVHSGMKGAWC